MKMVPDVDTLCTVLRAACRIDDAVGGLIHLISEEGCNAIAHNDLDPRFRALFDSCEPQDGTTISQVQIERRRVVVRDIRSDLAYAPYRAVAKGADVIAMQSTPILYDDKTLHGVLTTCFDRPHHPESEAFERIDLCADIIAKLLVANELDDRDTSLTYSPSALAVQALLPLVEHKSSLEVLTAVDRNLAHLIEELSTRVPESETRPADKPAPDEIQCQI